MIDSDSADDVGWLASSWERVAVVSAAHRPPVILLATSFQEVCIVQQRTLPGDGADSLQKLGHQWISRDPARSDMIDKA